MTDRSAYQRLYDHLTDLQSTLHDDEEVHDLLCDEILDPLADKLNAFESRENLISYMKSQARRIHDSAQAEIRPGAALANYINALDRLREFDNAV
jgi:hypothetical protein